MSEVDPREESLPEEEQAPLVEEQAVEVLLLQMIAPVAA